MGGDGSGGELQLTDALTEIVCVGLRTGNYISVVCGSVGITTSAFNTWARRGKNEYERCLNPDVIPNASELVYMDFYTQISEARTNAEIELVGMWREHAETNWQAARDFLARRYPERWGSKAGLKIRLDEGDDIESAIERELERLALGEEGGDALGAPITEQIPELADSLQELGDE